jgi:hypothetical protein
MKNKIKSKSLFISDRETFFISLIFFAVSVFSLFINEPSSYFLYETFFLSLGSFICMGSILYKDDEKELLFYLGFIIWILGSIYSDIISNINL